MANPGVRHTLRRLEESPDGRDSCCSVSVMSDFLQPHGPQCTRSAGPPSSPEAYSNSYPSNQWCHPPSRPLSSPSPPAFNLSQHQGLLNESVVHIRWPNYWSFSFSISPSNEYSGLISFMIDWFDLFAVQGTLKHLLQHHSSKASILWLAAFFMVQLSHPHVTTGGDRGRADFSNS